MSNLENAQKSRAWVATINNYKEEDYDKALNWTMVNYSIVGKEVGGCGTKHLQIYWRFPNAVRMSTIKKYFPTAHLEIAKGTPEQNITYCSKDDEWEEKGERPCTSKHLKGILYSLDSMMELMEEWQSNKITPIPLNINEAGEMLTDAYYDVSELLCEHDGIPDPEELDNTIVETDNELAYSVPLTTYQPCPTVTNPTVFDISMSDDEWEMPELKRIKKEF